MIAFGKNLLETASESYFAGLTLMRAERRSDGLLALLVHPYYKMLIVRNLGVFLIRKGDPLQGVALALTFDHIESYLQFPVGLPRSLRVYAGLLKAKKKSASWVPVNEDIPFDQTYTYQSNEYPEEVWVAMEKDEGGNKFICYGTEPHPAEVTTVKKVLGKVHYPFGESGSVLVLPYLKGSTFFDDYSLTASMVAAKGLLTKPPEVGVPANSLLGAPLKPVADGKKLKIHVPHYDLKVENGQIAGMDIAAGKSESIIHTNIEGAITEVKIDPGVIQQAKVILDHAMSGALPHQLDVQAFLGNPTPDPLKPPYNYGSWQDVKDHEGVAPNAGHCPRCHHDAMVQNHAIETDAYQLIENLSLAKLDGSRRAKVLVNDQHTMMGGSVAGHRCNFCGYAVNGQGLLHRSALAECVVAPWEEGSFPTEFTNEDVMVEEVEIVPVSRALELIALSGEPAQKYEVQLKHAAAQLDVYRKLFKELTKTHHEVLAEGLKKAGIANAVSLPLIPITIVE